jgi:uncharacterized protein
MNGFGIPGERACLELLVKYQTPQHIIQHCQRVWDVARVLGEALLQRTFEIDMPLLRASSLLHDIGKYPCILDGQGYHDIRGEQILDAEGYPDVARIVGQHVVLRTPSDPIREEHIVFYADKRVVHDEIVSLDQRFVYLRETYGKTRVAISTLQVMKQDTMRLEREIFLHLDFRPDDVLGLVASSDNGRK